ncbi:MAG: hypothetical protein HY737_08600 [Candidatus Omnitrophica bacterium]|nr:hypothetical protein [Candidatus Omnitrophota bacterium]
MKMPKLLVGSAMVSILSLGCSTIHFQNGQDAATPETNSEWHHTVAFSLVEASDPVDLHDRCNGKPWHDVMVERSFLNGLAGSIDSLIVGVDLWEPWTVEYSCRD